MFKDLSPAQRLAAFGLALLCCGFGAYAIAKGRKEPAPIVFEPIPKAAPSAAAPGPGPAFLVVHAAGAVKKPGLVRLAADARVEDAIEAAGGATKDADLEAVNLAAHLTDGLQVFVPHKGAPAEASRVADPIKGGVVAASIAPSGRTPQRAGSGKKQPSGPVSLNTGSEADLESLPGIGPSTAQKIIDYRQEHGGFSSVDELMAVKGIGPKKLKAMRKYLRL